MFAVDPLLLMPFFFRYEKLLEDEVEEKDMQVKQGEIEIMRVAAKEKTKRQLERERMKKELEHYRSVEAEYRVQTQQMKKMKDILDSNAAVKVATTERIATSSSDSNLKTPARGREPARTSEPKSSLRVYFFSL